MSDLPVVCTLSPAALKARREGHLTHLLAQSEDRREMPDGYRLRFAATDDILLAIARTVDAERQCCRFLRFHVTVEPDGGPIWLEMIGRLEPASFLPRCSNHEHGSGVPTLEFANVARSRNTIADR